MVKDQVRNVDDRLMVLRAVIKRLGTMTEIEVGPEEARQVRFTGHQALNAVEQELANRRRIIERGGLLLLNGKETDDGA
jgi:hypothetical protein